MNNLTRYLTKICEFEVLGIEPRISAEKLKEIYLIDNNIADKYIELMNKPDFRQLVTLSQVQIHKNFICAYSADIFGGSNSDEELLINAKLMALKKMSELCGSEKISLETITHHISQPYAKTIIGLGYVFGFFTIKNVAYGNELLSIAAKDNDIDAKLFHLLNHPEEAQEVLTTIANTNEYVYKTDDLRVWLKHYKVENVRIKQTAFKLGFGI